MIRRVICKEIPKNIEVFLAKLYNKKLESRSILQELRDEHPIKISEKFLEPERYLIEFFE